MGAVAVRLPDPGSQVGQAVGRQQQVQPSGDPQALPGAGGLGEGGAADAGGGEGLVRVVVDRVERLRRPVAVDEALRPLGPDVLDADQVGEDRLGVGVRRRQGARLGDLDLPAVAAVLDPGPGHVGALALLEVDQGADQHDRRAVGAGRLDDGPAGLGVGEAGAADGHL